MRVVFDANVIISAMLIHDSTSGLAFFKALDQDELLISASIIQELNDVLLREKFNPYLLQEERERFLAALLREATLVDITEPIRVCRDPKDNQYLEVAVSGQADVIVSGDEDLLVLNPFRNVAIISVGEFLNFSR